MPDKKHTLLAAKDWSMENVAPVPTPRVVNQTAAANADDEVSDEMASLFSRAVGRLVYLSQGRYGVQFAVRLH